MHVVVLYIEDIEGYGTLENDLYSALENADTLVLMTAHEEFKSINFKKVNGLIKTLIVVDGRRIYDHDELRKLGFNYNGSGAINKVTTEFTSRLENLEFKSQKAKNVL